jgi:FixJ family two-component response regulator
MRQNKILLIVDDEISIRTLLQGFLRRHGYQTLAAASGEEALMVCNRPGIQIGCLLTDYHMPGINGRQLAERLLDRYPGLRVILMSGAECAVRGHPCLRKPFSLDQVISQVQAAMPARLRDEPADGQAVALDSLTRREREVLRLLAEGFSARLVARELGIKYKTVECHRSRIYGKLELQGIVSLVRFAIRNGISQV